MSEVQSGKALHDLVLFLVYLAVLGLLMALAVYYTAVLPAQQAAGAAPVNMIL